MSRFQSWRAALCLACLTAPMLIGCGKKEVPQQAAPAPKEAVALPAPFGLHTDDLDEMLKRRNIRALVMIDPIDFFYSNGQPMGIAYEGMREFESFINQKMKTRALKVEVTFVPVRPDQLEAALTQGVGDLIAFGLVVTPERQNQVAFTIPVRTAVKQVLVTGPGFGTASNLEELSGKRVYVNPLSANYQSLQAVNRRLQEAGRQPIVVKTADKNLLDDDLVQMVNAGLIPSTVTRIARAELWSQVLPHVTVHPDLVIASGEQIALAVRKGNPQLKQLLDEFIEPRVEGTTFGNVLLRRYLQNTKWVTNSISPEEMRKFAALSTVFKQYAGQYDFDYLMLMAQGYQESLLDQHKRNPSGAVGIMQVIPRDAAASPINVPDVTRADNNILAGTKILRNIEDQYFNDPKIDPVDKTLMAFASYNAGANRIARLRQQAGEQGLDPNKWFDNVELMVAKDVGQETVTYVGNVYKYYVAYKLALEQPDAAQKGALGHGS